MIAKTTLSKEQVEELIWDSKYKTNDKENPINLDELAIIILAAENFGFEIDKKKTEAIVNKMLGHSNSQKDTSFNGAILQVRGNYSFQSIFSISTDEGHVKGNLLIFHETIANNIHKTIAKKLIENKAVKLFPGTDEEYLYEVLTESAEVHLYEMSKKLAPELPLYLVDFEDDGSFKVQEMGLVNNS